MVVNKQKHQVHGPIRLVPTKDFQYENIEKLLKSGKPR